MTHAERIVGHVARTCSLDRVLVAGEDIAGIADRLRLLGADVREVEADSASVIVHVLAADTTTYSLAIVRLEVAEPGIEAARRLVIALRPRSRALYLEIAAGGEVVRRADEVGGRSWWERQAVACGFRRHPLITQIVSYESMGAASSVAQLLLEAAPDNDAIPAVDDLRSVGLMADATLARYERATHFIRRHDRVLDLDCGVGAGLAMVGPLASASSTVGIVRTKVDAIYASVHFGRSRSGLEFRVTNPADLSEFAEESFDVVLSCRPLPSMFWSAEVLEEINRILTPGGRLICCVETAHLDVRNRVGEFLIPERLFGQRGRHPQEGDWSRSWHEMDIAWSEKSAWIDWWMLVAMKDPRAGHSATYEERLFPRTVFPGGPNPTAYVRAFDNPWLHAGVFNQGNRLTNGLVLHDVCREIADGPSVPDAAAAACVLGYGLLEADALDPGATLTWLDEIDERFQTLTGTAPISLRWRVSLLFVAGRLALRLADRARALRYFRACMMQEATQFSSLLATRTIEAAYWVGFLHARLSDFSEASSAWSRGVAIAKSCIDAEAAIERDTRVPIELFGFREFAQVFDAAGRCAAGIEALGAGPQWEQRLSRTMRHASFSVAFATELADVRRALEDERQRSERTFRELQSLHEAQVLAVKTASSTALLRQIVHRCRGERSILVWGAGAAGRRLATLAQHLGATIEAFVDSDPAKQGTVVRGMEVLAPQVLSAGEWAGAFILIGSVYAADIETRLVRLGLARDADFLAFEPESVGLPTTGTASRPRPRVPLEKPA